ncbi:M20/M25/M40 family metallo-hydrolase [Paenibacillus tuaregi]|uniref:M20/M25/M40 family metallo-hydrolase n=1 Tax=Paenibacillus tuaregi TaxID=1816681 RepID=UPI000838D56D|nr:M20/M25/M40 family metallo-hydrolase [Paenibacillus tuaregi]
MQGNKQFKIAWWLKSLVILVIVIAVGFVGLLPIRAPEPLGKDAAADQFSSARAAEKLAVIAKQPHPLGSAAQKEVRDYLLSELRQLGLQPEVQKATVKYKRYPDKTETEAEIENILARIPGTDNSKALMLTAHYDSVPTGPGAGDDGSGIAAILETIRAIKVSGSLKNDVIVLMTDGEEMGLLGAKAFMKEHPWAKDAGLALNFEARGNQGPSLMFETSDGNGWLVQEFIKAAPTPHAYSLIYNLYKMMPNDTDMTVLRRGGLQGLNFAFGGGIDAYHGPSDTPENLDPGSLQHQGEYMLALTRHFGQLDLTTPPQENRVFFNVFASVMTSYPQSWAIWLAAIGVLLYAIMIWLGLRSRALNVKRTGTAFLLSAGTLLIVYGVITLVWKMVRFIVSDQQWAAILLDSKISDYSLFALLILTFVIVAAAARLISKYINSLNMWAGTLLLWVIASIVTALYLPGGSYLLIWPLLFSTLGLLASFKWHKKSPWWINTLVAVPGILLFSPILYLTSTLITLEAAPAICALGAFTATLLYPALIEYEHRPSVMRTGRADIPLQ